MASEATSGLCATEGQARFLCGVRQPEDLYVVPGTHWIVTSSLAGGIFLVNAREKKPVALYPAANARERFDRRTYSTCPGPPDAAAKARFSTLGINVTRGRRGLHRLYVTRYPGASGVDVFDLDVRGTPFVTWIGCVPSPDKVLANSVLGLPDGGLLTTSFYDTGPGSRESRARAEAGEITGDLWSWRPRQGWRKIPGTQSSGTNGLEISRDGRTAYINQWGSRTFMRVSLDSAVPRRDIVPFDYRPDNLHWTPDGKLLIAGHTDRAGYLAKIDPTTLKVTPLLCRQDTPAFVHFSGAIEIGGEIWVGSSRSDRIAVYTLPIEPNCPVPSQLATGEKE